jgi:ABC-type Fe3+ transport system permease subunit
MAITHFTPSQTYPRSSGLFHPTITVTSSTYAGAVTWTAAQLLGGFIRHDPAGNVSDVTDTAANLVAAIPGAAVGASFTCHFQNDADASETITLTGGTGVTIAGTATIAQNSCKNFLFVITNVTAGTEAITAYSLGSSTY